MKLCYCSSVLIGTMSATLRFCKMKPDSFCYICGEYTIDKQKNNITDFVKQFYLAYFRVRLGEQDKSWAPHIACKTCVELLRSRTKGRRHLKFGKMKEEYSLMKIVLNKLAFNDHKWVICVDLKMVHCLL